MYVTVFDILVAKDYCQFSTEYLLTEEGRKIIQLLVDGYKDTAIALNCGIMLRECIKVRCIHEYLPVGLVRYYPLSQNLIVEGQFDDHYNCINNPITLYRLDGSQICQQNADYSMEPDNYNVRYVNF